MTSREVVIRLKSQSSWRLVFLSFLTVGIYMAHYIKRQTKIINDYLGKEQKISESFVNSILILSYVTVILLVPLFWVEEGHPVERIGNLLDRFLTFVFIFWAFMARNRMNMLLALDKYQPQWFHGLWTFLFPVFYFNYKINKLSKDVAGTDASPNASP